MSATATHTDDEEQLRAIVSHLQDAWNRNDAAAWAEPFLPEARFINLRADVFPGRQAIEESHKRIFNGFYKDSHDEMTIESITFPATDVAVMDVMHAVTNYGSLPPGIVPTEPGVLKALMRFVAVRQDGEWRFAAAQNTSVFPPPPAK